MIPIFLYGVPITGKPLDRHLLALAIGLNRVQVFAGVTINKTAAPQTLMAGEAATASQLTSDLHIHWVTKLAVGTNLPVNRVITALKGSK